MFEAGTHPYVSTFYIFDDRDMQSKMEPLHPRHLESLADLLHTLPFTIIQKLLLIRRLNIQRKLPNVGHMQVLQYHRNIVRAESLVSDLSAEIEGEGGDLGQRGAGGCWDGSEP
jgi:hypothetical protein